MKSVICPKAGPPAILQIKDVQKPVPKDNEVVVKVHYGTVTSGDVKLRLFNRIVLTILGALFGFKVMKTPGVEYSGVVEEVGGNVKDFKKGDAVCGTTTGLQYGANAEYVCVPVKPKSGVIIHKPEGLSFKESAAVIVGLMTASFILKKAAVKAGDSLLVYGASGSVGNYAVQLGKHFGCKVTGVCGPSNIDLLKSIGADEVIDYTKEDFTGNGKTYDVIIDAVGKTSKKKCRPLLTKNSRYGTVNMPTDEVKEDLEYGQKLAAEGKIKVLIDKEYTLDQIVEAHEYVEGGHKKGNVVIKIAW